MILKEGLQYLVLLDKTKAPQKLMRLVSHNPKKFENSPIFVQLNEVINNGSDY